MPLHPTVRKKKYQAMQISCFKTCLLGYFIESMNDADKQMALDRLRFQNVQFLIYGNTLLAYPVKRQDLYEVAEEDMVQAGLPTIVALQQAGYIYVRP